MLYIEFKEWYFYLDVLINNETHFSVTGVYRKKIFTGL